MMAQHKATEHQRDRRGPRVRATWGERDNSKARHHLARVRPSAMIPLWRPLPLASLNSRPLRLSPALCATSVARMVTMVILSIQALLFQT